MPYGVEVNKELTSFTNSNSILYRNNINEWKDGSGLLQLDINNLQTVTQNTSLINSNVCNVYNGGDVETGFTLELKIGAKTNNITLTKLGNWDKDMDGPIKLINMNDVPSGYNRLCMADDEGTIMITSKQYTSIEDEIMMCYYTDEGKYIEGMTGKIVRKNNKPYFESFTNGQLYELYGYGNITKDNVFKYEISGVTSIKDKKYWGKILTATIYGTDVPIYLNTNHKQYASKYGYFYTEGNKIFTLVKIY